MPRPRKNRIIRGCPPAHIFKPAGVPARDLDNAILSHGEYEAIRLADLEGMSQEEGAKRMGISRATFGRILNSGHRSIADALVNGKTLVIEGGDYRVRDEQHPEKFIPGRCRRGRRGRGQGRFRGGD